MRHFFIVSNAYKDKDFQLTKKLSGYIREHGGVSSSCATFPEEEQKKSVNLELVPPQTECILVLGGDGTLIRAARDLVELEIPLIGVNMGTLGYLCELKESTVFDAISQIMDDRYMVEERMMICGRKDGIRAIALNDLVIHRGASLPLAKLIVSVNGQYLATYDADGIIIATPTGSTGYSMSAGGPIVKPDADMLLVTPISSHALNAKSIVLSAKDRITVELGARRRQRDDEVSVVLDGDQTFVLTAGEKIEVTQSERKTKILKLTSDSFLEILQKKMRVSN